MDFAGKIKHLGNDFAGGQVASQAALAGGAKDAAQAAAHLGGDAGRAPLVVAHQHAFQGLPVAQVKEHSKWVTSAPGGRGAAREICEVLLDARGLLEEKLQSYL